MKKETLAIRLEILKEEYPIHQIENGYFIGYFFSNIVMMYSLNYDKTHGYFKGSAKIRKSQIIFRYTVYPIKFDYKKL